ncbi:MAG: YchJ family metal-binding protein [Pseudomonadota bacterium]
MTTTETQARVLVCPCGLGTPPVPTPTPPYTVCCGQFHDGPTQGLAPTAEALMRSRYAAFVLARTDYLLATWHPTTRPATLSAHEPDLKWLGLQVLRHRVDADGVNATVEFVARSKVGGRAQRLHEVSRFVREDGRWLYVCAVETGR